MYLCICAYVIYVAMYVHIRMYVYICVYIRTYVTGPEKTSIIYTKNTPIHIMLS